uniref:Uncharacterized protein n=1 Tax=Glossina austeni TaxID=7395 RepID=A0A1A9UQV5_GLOAU
MFYENDCKLSPEYPFGTNRNTTVIMQVNELGRLRFSDTTVRLFRNYQSGRTQRVLFDKCYSKSLTTSNYFIDSYNLNYVATYNVPPILEYSSVLSEHRSPKSLQSSITSSATAVAEASHRNFLPRDEIYIDDEGLEGSGHGGRQTALMSRKTKTNNYRPI